MFALSALLSEDGGEDADASQQSFLFTLIGKQSTVNFELKGASLQSRSLTSSLCGWLNPVCGCGLRARLACPLVASALQLVALAAHERCSLQSSLLTCVFPSSVLSALQTRAGQAEVDVWLAAVTQAVNAATHTKHAVVEAAVGLCFVCVFCCL